jgi:hypothetical protein
MRRDRCAGSDRSRAGDLVSLTFDPQAGHEPRGRRPALILSPRAYHTKPRPAIACQITSHAKSYPFEVALPALIAQRALARDPFAWARINLSSSCTSIGFAT